MNKPTANISFSDFASEIAAIHKCMTDDDRREFRKSIYNYYKRKEPKEGWKTLITEVIGNSETEIKWGTLNDLDDLSAGKGDLTRAIARYYFLHSLTHDLSFANAVDGVVFKNWPSGKRTYEGAKGQPVFQVPLRAAQTDDETWKSALHQWRHERIVNRRTNHLLASLSIERTQGGDTREPIAFLAEVHIRPAYEYESGIELRFKTVDIVIECNDRYPSELAYNIQRETLSEGITYRFQLSGTGSAPYVILTNNGDGLDGTYVSGTLVTFYPKCRSANFCASLRLRIINTNAVFPEDIESNMKREIIKRMVEKEILPRPDASGHIALHDLEYQVSAIEKN